MPPGRRTAPLSVYETNRATGFPAFAMMISSPPGSQIDEPRKLRFRLVNIDFSHSGLSVVQCHLPVKEQEFWFFRQLVMVF